MAAGTGNPRLSRYAEDRRQHQLITGKIKTGKKPRKNKIPGAIFNCFFAKEFFCLPLTIISPPY
jgi:hypothetical protein